MTDDPSSAKPGLTDAELAVHPTVFASDAFKDQVVVISGGAGGIGRAIAWLFARLGAHVALIGRDQGKLDALVAQLTSRGLKASAHAADIRDPEAVNALFDASGTNKAASTASSTVPAGSFRKRRSISR